MQEQSLQMLQRVKQAAPNAQYVLFSATYTDEVRTFARKVCPHQAGHRTTAAVQRFCCAEVRPNGQIKSNQC
jgi:superfamily II DNA/RNA helicase